MTLPRAKRPIGFNTQLVYDSIETATRRAAVLNDMRTVARIRLGGFAVTTAADSEGRYYVVSWVPISPAREG